MRVSPNQKIDWTSRDEVKSYYSSFDVWSTVVRIGTMSLRVLGNVKDGILEYEGKFYLPMPQHTKKKWNEPIEDGLQYTEIFMSTFHFYGRNKDKDGEYHQVLFFHPTSPVSKALVENINMRKDFWSSRILPFVDNKECVDFMRNNIPDKNYVLFSELRFFMSNMILFYEEYLPYFNKNKEVRRLLSMSMLANGKYVSPDSYFRGPVASGLNYGLRIEYQGRIIEGLSLDKKDLQRL